MVRKITLTLRTSTYVSQNLLFIELGFFTGDAVGFHTGMQLAYVLPCKVRVFAQEVVIIFMGVNYVTMTTTKSCMLLYEANAIMRFQLFKLDVL